MQLQEVKRVKNITRKEFIRDYVKPQIPVVIENLIEDWPAYSKWNLDYIREIAGEQEVPLYDQTPVKHELGFNEPHAKMRMRDYIDLLKKGPTYYRIFLYLSLIHI